MRRFGSRIPGIVATLLAVLLPSPALTLAAPGPGPEATALRVLLLSERSVEPASLSTASLLLAVSVQLEPLGAVLEHRVWDPARAPPDQRRSLAEQIGRDAAAPAVIWYSVAADGAAQAAVAVHVTDLTFRPAVTWSQTMGSPGEGIERSMAVAVCTLLRAAFLDTPARELGRDEGAPAPARPRVPRGEIALSATSAGSARPASNPGGALLRRPRPPRASPARLELSASYGLSLLPLGAELRHGPLAAARVRLWRGLGVELSAGYLVMQDGDQGPVSWTRSGVPLAVALAYEWRLASRWELAAGGRLGAVVLRAAARDGGDGRREVATVWELGPGAVGRAAIRMGERLAAACLIGVDWLAVGHRLSVRGAEVARSGALALSLSAGLAVRLW